MGCAKRDLCELRTGYSESDHDQSVEGLNDKSNGYARYQRKHVKLSREWCLGLILMSVILCGTMLVILSQLNYSYYYIELNTTKL